MEVNQTHEKIIETLKEKGPSLPIQIAKQINLSSLFVSAYLSELANEKRIKISHLKVGGSPLYFLKEQEELLQPFHKFLHPREIDAFLLLKQKKILKDSEQEPATRVALRSIRDFAIGFKKQEEIFWRYFLIPESEINNLLSSEKKPKSKEKKPKTTESDKQLIKTMQKTKQEFLNPLANQATAKQKKQKQKSEFIQKIINLINQQYKIIEEKDYKSKEYNCLIQIKTQLGPINFLTQAKDKKSVSETDLKKLLSNAQSIPLPALFIYTGKLSKKAQEYKKKYFSILKTLKLN